MPKTLVDGPDPEGSAPEAAGYKKPSATIPDGDEPTATPNPDAADQPDDEGPDPGPPPVVVGRRSLVYLLAGGLLTASVVGPLVFYFAVWRSRSTALHHLPANTIVAVRLDGRELYTYEPFRKHVLGALDGSDKVNARSARFKKHTSIDPMADVREIYFAATSPDAWVLVFGGRFEGKRGGHAGFADGVAKFLAEEGASDFTVKDGRLFVGGLVIAQAADTAILVANTSEILDESFETSDNYKSIALASSGAVSFVALHAALDALGRSNLKKPSSPAPFLLDPRPILRALALESLFEPCDHTDRANGYLEFGKCRLTIDLAPAAGTSPEQLAKEVQRLQVDVAPHEGDLPEALGLTNALVGAQVKPRAETVMLAGTVVREKLDRGLAKLGESIRDLLAG
ncbi:MAG: hypothetical protein U0271_16550 [Polyangiaceae bacterium]